MPVMKRSPWLGKQVSVKIDRPMGSVRRSGRFSVKYPVNCGCASGMPDGPKLDAYVLNVDGPMCEFSGKVIGVIHRQETGEDRLVVAPEGARIHQAQIAEAVDFIERRYTTVIESTYRKACGAVVFRRRGGVVEYLLLLQRRSRRWSVPKGHMELGETEAQTAQREVREETGRAVSLIRGFQTELEYTLSGPVRKRVVLYLAKMQESPRVQWEEIVDYRWVTLAQAKELLGEGYAGAIERADQWLAAHKRGMF